MRYLGVKFTPWIILIWFFMAECIGKEVPEVMYMRPNLEQSNRHKFRANIQFKDDSPISLSCQVGGGPFSWYHCDGNSTKDLLLILNITVEGNNWVPNIPHYHIQAYMNGSLLIRTSNIEDQSIYVCLTSASWSIYFLTRETETDSSISRSIFKNTGFIFLMVIVSAVVMGKIVHKVFAPHSTENLGQKIRHIRLKRGTNLPTAKEESEDDSDRVVRFKSTTLDTLDDDDDDERNTRGKRRGTNETTGAKLSQSKRAVGNSQPTTSSKQPAPIQTPPGIEHMVSPKHKSRKQHEKKMNLKNPLMNNYKARKRTPDGNEFNNRRAWANDNGKLSPVRRIGRKKRF